MEETEKRSFEVKSRRCSRVFANEAMFGLCLVYFYEEGRRVELAFRAVNIVKLGEKHR